MEYNINTKEYWESRFYSKNWNSMGRNQTKKYARANIAHMNISNDFNGTLLDFGCALGDAIPVYSETFPKAKLFGFDISETAIIECKKRFGSLAEFITGDITQVTRKNIIIASHVMEHLTDDKAFIKTLLLKCNDLYVFVPYKENPLYHEHVNYYTELYYEDFNVLEKKRFTVSYKTLLPYKSIIKNIIMLRFSFHYNFCKDIIMFHLSSDIG